MKLTPFLFYILLLSSTFSYAQQGYGGGERHPMNEEASALSIFSESGDQFFLVLNGVSQNNVPVSRIRVEGLPQYGNDIQILFADRMTPEISRRINIADPVDGKAVNMTLKIVRNREGEARLRFFRCSEVEHGYRAEQGEYVMTYGQPVQANGGGYGSGNAGQGWQGNTTVTTTTSNYAQPAQPVQPAQPLPPAAMDPQTFNDVKQSISNASFEDTKLSTAKTILASNYVNTDQVMEICGLFSFENTKLVFAKFAYNKTVDKNNYYKVNSVFDFDSNKQALNEFISRGGR